MMRFHERLLRAFLACIFLASGTPLYASVTSPQKTLRSLAGRQLWVPICSRRGVNGSAAYFDSVNTAVMDQVSCVAPSYGTVTAVKLVYAAFDMPQQGEVDRPVTATGVAAVSVPSSNLATLYTSAASASGVTTLSFASSSLGTNSASVGQTVASATGIATGTYVTAVTNGFTAGGGNTPTTTVLTLSSATTASVAPGQAVTLSGMSVAAKFAGRRQFTIEPAHDVVTSDPIAVQLAPSQQFFVRTAASFSAAGLQLMDYPGTGSRVTGEFDSRGTSLNDQTLLPVVLTNTGGGYWCPVAVLALVTLSPGNVAPGAVLVLGDSIGAGTGDIADALGLQGYIQRSLENAIPFVTAARGSTTAFGLAARGDGQYALSIDTGITDVMIELGRNDILSLQVTDVVAEASIKAAATRYVNAGKRVWCFTIPPTTQSNDSWQTLANQSWTVAVQTLGTAVAAGSSTAAMQSVAGIAVGQSVSGAGVAAGTLVTAISGLNITLSAPAAAAIPVSTRLSFGITNPSLVPAEAYRLSYNSFLRTTSGSLGCTGLIDDDKIFADSGGSGKWRADLGSASADGVHPSAALHQAAVNAGLIKGAMFLPQ